MKRASAKSKRIFPSLMAYDQEELSEKFSRVRDLTDTFHLDIVDGEFAPSLILQFDFKVPKSYKYNVHLMTKNPREFIETHMRKKHFELFIPQISMLGDPGDYATWMRHNSRKVAFAFSPDDDVKHFKHVLAEADYVLVLTVNPGYYGSKFVPKALNKIAAIKKANPLTKVIVDGHMDPQTIALAQKKGADYFVCGSYLMGAENPSKAFKKLVAALK